MAARETGLTTATEEANIDLLKKDIRDAEDEMARTVRQIRERISYEALKNRALAEARVAAVEKPKQLATLALGGAYRYARKAEELSKRNPILPLVTGIVVLTPLLVRSIMRRGR